LSNAGHIASLVNPPGNPKASYYIDGETGADPEIWLKSATKKTGSWWQVWSEWTTERSGDVRPASERLGSAAHPPLQPAPGSYVRDRVPS
jgi:polyhydroxyalkanoate synthase